MEPTKNIQTKWLSFIKYFHLPLAILGCLFDDLSSETISWDSIVVYALYPILLINLFNYKKSAINLYKAFSLISPILMIHWRLELLSSLKSISNDEYTEQFIIGYILLFIVWSLPNYKYIEKRMHLFSDNSIIDRHIQEFGQPIKKKTSKSNEPKQVSTFDSIEAINKLAKLKDEGTLTEEEFQTKKKELLDRI